MGEIVLAESEKGIVALGFQDLEWLRQRVERMWGTVRWSTGRASPAVVTGIEGFLEGDGKSLDSLPVDVCGTPFQTATWRALRDIPWGSTESYGALAKRVGRPRAARAVGMVVGQNPVSLVVPCHRVIGAAGALTGYLWGVDRKRWLLAHESAKTGRGAESPGHPPGERPPR